MEEEEDIVEVEARYSEKEKYAVFDKEFMPHIDSMYNFAFRLTNDEDDANDLVQDTYLKAFRFINSSTKVCAPHSVSKRRSRWRSMWVVGRHNGPHSVCR